MASSRKPRLGRRQLGRWQRAAWPVLVMLALLFHASGVFENGALRRLDDVLYDVRLRLAAPRTLDERIVIVDIDERSLAEVGRWPWGRDRLAALTHELFERQRVATLGFDLVFGEPDRSSGLDALRRLARRQPEGDTRLADTVRELAPTLDNDRRFADALQRRSVVLGCYLTSDRRGFRHGVLPAPVLDREALAAHPMALSRWDGYGGNLPLIAQAAASAGYFNAIVDPDGSVRTVPLLAEFDGQAYEALSLAVVRQHLRSPAPVPVFADSTAAGTGAPASLTALLLTGEGAGAHGLRIPVDRHALAWVPFRGPGGPSGGSYTYVSAADLLAKRLPEGDLQGKIVLVGSTAPGLMDLRSTPLGEAYPGVEVHANLIAGMLDGQLRSRPDFARGYEVSLMLALGLILALTLPRLGAGRAVVLSVSLLAVVLALDAVWFHKAHAVMPLAGPLALVLLAFTLDMVHGYTVESRNRRRLARLFGTYVPSELVSEMVNEGGHYDMRAETREMTVMFCDMRGFTQLAENLPPTEVQALLNEVFNRLTRVIRERRGTIDKYIGDAIMAFWGAPVADPAHAAHAVDAALALVDEVARINQERAHLGSPPIFVSIGLSSGSMCVGDMGSDLRRSYTVIGDAVNLGARIEGLTRHYGVDVLASDATREQASAVEWQALDRVRVKGRSGIVTLWQPLPPLHPGDCAARSHRDTVLDLWRQVLDAYRLQKWEPCAHFLAQLCALDGDRQLYRLYRERVTSRKALAPDATWTGVTEFDSK